VPSSRSRLRAVHAGAFVALFTFYAWAGVGLVSSNDGAHLALARALALRHETTLGPDVPLTLGVDLAVYEGRAHADRPPGTAFSAYLLVAALGRLDGWFAERTRARGAVLVRPASQRYLVTYALRFRDPPPLYTLQGSVLAGRLAAAAFGAAGVLLCAALARTLGAGPLAAAFAAAHLGLASLWAVYATVLFSHVFAGTYLAAAFLCAARTHAPSARRAAAVGLWSGAAAICEFALVPTAVAAVLLLLPRRRWLAGAAGLAVPAVLAGAYHTAAFGRPWRIGYDFARFAFARERAATFSGNLLDGFETLFGIGHGAGLLALAPLLVLGVGAFARARPRIALALAPFLVLLCIHATPEGGAFADHRYLVPVLPVFAAGAGLVLDRARRLPPPGRYAAVFVLLAAAGFAAVRVLQHARFIYDR